MTLLRHRFAALLDAIGLGRGLRRDEQDADCVPCMTLYMQMLKDSDITPEEMRRRWGHTIRPLQNPGRDEARRDGTS